MAHLARGAVSSAANPLLSIWTCDEKLLVDPDAGSLAFVINDITTEEKECVPVVAVGPTTVNLTTARIGTGVGHFAAACTIPPTEPVGAHEIVWTWTLDAKPYTYAQRFDVLAGVPRGLGDGYTLVSDFRAEGLSATTVSDLRLLKLIRDQSAWAEQVTGRFFEPRFMDVRVDGTDSAKLLLGMPIIALDGVSILEEPIPIDPASRELIIYNRHLRGMIEPDDRRAPRIEVPELIMLSESFYSHANATDLLMRTAFVKNAQNVQVQGLFGYTDPDGSPLGRTPLGLHNAVMLLVKRNAPTLACDSDGFDGRMANRVTSMTTRDQSITFAAAGLGTSPFTGDIEIDNLLSPYVRPMRIYST